VQISRLDGIHWLEMSENDELFSKIPAHLTTAVPRAEGEDADKWQAEQLKRKEELTTADNNLIKKPYSFHARIQVELS
jgi:hypothetical protein